jgi:hypothetical protein
MHTSHPHRHRRLSKDNSLLRLCLFILLLVHGLIHLGSLARSTGLLWGLVSVLMLASAALVQWRDGRWWMLAGVAIVISQVLIIGRWQDARLGTIANVLLLLAVVTSGASWQFHRRYTAAVSIALARTKLESNAVIVEHDLLNLPSPIQRYLRAAGVVGTRRPRSMRIELSGQIRSEGGPWMPFTTEQFNTFDVPARFFWMDATMKGLPTKGFHSYDDGVASMRIKLHGLFPVVDVAGPELDTAETVTWFNDLCLFAPGALLDSRITWKAIDDHSASATFSRHRQSITAVVMWWRHQHRRCDDDSAHRQANIATSTVGCCPAMATPSGNCHRSHPAKPIHLYTAASPSPRSRTTYESHNAYFYYRCRLGGSRHSQLYFARPHGGSAVFVRQQRRQSSR